MTDSLRVVSWHDSIGLLADVRHPLIQVTPHRLVQTYLSYDEVWQVYYPAQDFALCRRDLSDQ